MAEKRRDYKKQTNTIDSLNAIYGKVPPQDVEIEKAVLGATLIQSEAIYSIIDILSKESFYETKHQHIYESILNLASQHKPIDLYTVSEELKAGEKLDEIGGLTFLSELTDRIATTAHLEFHAKIVQQKYLQRQLINSAAEIQRRSFDEGEDVEELINFAEESIFRISEGNIKKESVKIDRLIPTALENIEEASKNKNSLLGVPSGFTAIDRFTSGWQKSDMIIIAARPSMGKTAFVLSMARNIAVEHNRPVAIFSLEMSSIQLVNRLISSEAEIPGNKLKTGELQEFEWEQLESRVKNLEAAPIFLDDTPAISVFEFRAKCRRLCKTHNIQAIIIDYLQLMTAGTDNKGNREQEVSQISRSLKAIAKELDLPIIALSQLSRAVEARTGNNKRPQLSDLRESGAIEQDADMVLFIHRPEYYGMLVDEEGNSTAGIAEIIIAKHRNGATGSAYINFKKEFAKFDDKSEGIIFESKLNTISEDALDPNRSIENNENFYDNSENAFF